MSDSTPTDFDQQEQASRLLRAGLAGPRRPVDGLVERLRREDGAQWLTAALERGPGGDAGLQATALGDRSLSVEQLSRLKDASKRAIESNPVDERLTALAVYFLAIAAGLRDHGVQIGARGRDELETTLLDLAEFMPPPYDTLLCEATLVG